MRVYKIVNSASFDSDVSSSVWGNCHILVTYYWPFIWTRMFLLIQSPSLHSQHAGTVRESIRGQHKLRSCCVTILYLSFKELLSEKCIWLPFPAEFCLFEMFKKSIDLTSNRLGFAGCVKSPNLLLCHSQVWTSQTSSSLHTLVEDFFLAIAPLCWAKCQAEEGGNKSLWFFISGIFPVASDKEMTEDFSSMHRSQRNVETKSCFVHKMGK